jgi:hypothetical protein
MKFNYVVCLSDTCSSCHVTIMGTGSFRPESRSPPESFRPYSRSPRFINSALKNTILIPHTVTIVVCKKKSFILVYFKYLFIFKFQVFINKKNQSNIVGQLTKQCVLFKEILRINKYIK